MINKLGLDSAGNNPLKRRNWYMQVSGLSDRCGSLLHAGIMCVYGAPSYVGGTQECSKNFLWGETPVNLPTRRLNPNAME